MKNLPKLVPFIPLFFFAVGGTSLFASMYLTPDPGPLIAAIAGVLLLCGFVVFLRLRRPRDRAAIGSVAPTIIGPLLAHLYVKFRADELQNVLAAGGDLLIQLAFFFASLFGATAYMFVMVGEDSTTSHYKIKMWVYLGLLFLLLFGMNLFELTDRAGREGPVLAFGIEAPRLTNLTLSRVILALMSVIVATWPPPRQSVARTAGDTPSTDKVVLH
jgi:hypothetical protein